MKINVYRLRYHTILEDKDGHEVSRTSPETVKVAAESLDEAVLCLPKYPGDPLRKNVLLQSQVLQDNVVFQGSVQPQPQAVVREAPKAEAKA